VVTLGDWRADAGLREWVLASKHGGRADLACELGVALAERLLACTRGGALSPDRAAPLLVPVPLHSIRRWSRGYDQAALLASSLAEHTGLDSRRALVRTRATPPQGAPGSRSRRANVRDAFRVRRGSARVLLARDVWIVDDVATSLATLAACAQALRRAGAAEVGGLVLARAGEA